MTPVTTQAQAPADNPLLGDAEWPAFSEMRAEHVTPAIDCLLKDAQHALERAVGPEVLPDYDTLSMVLDVPVERLNTVWGHVCHLQAVADTPALRQAHADNLPRIVDFLTRLGSDQRLYAKYKSVQEQAQSSGLAAAGSKPISAARQQALAHALRDFVLGGAELQGQARDRYAQIQDRTSLLSQQFGDHVLDATEAFTLDVDTADLTGVPDDVIEAAQELFASATSAPESVEGAELAPEIASVESEVAFEAVSDVAFEAVSEAASEVLSARCRLTLKAPCYVPVMQYAASRDIRERLFRAHHTRASELGPATWDNSPLMRELLALRQEEAALLGYPSFADAALVPKMARSPAEVMDFVRDLARRARPRAEKDLAELQAFAADELGLQQLAYWDRAYASEKLKQKRYAFSSQELKLYFTEPRVLEGLFGLVETLFGVAIRQEQAPVWHPSVRYYRVWRGERPLAAFYLDPHARTGKQGGAWMSDLRSRWQRPEGHLQLPVAHLVCNFAPPVGKRPALLTHDELITLFHEFGHGLHHMLTQVDELAVAGIAGVEHDAVELPSQFMENFCWEWEVLQRLSGHVDTGEKLPRTLFDRMVAARHFQSSLGLLRQCEFALFDMRLHSEPDAAQRLMEVMREVCAEIQPSQPPDFYRYAHTFGHLFDGGYSAGYYGYAWAEVLSADAYAAFEEDGVFDPATGQRFLQNILEVGGSRAALENFKAFRGREPKIDALLRHQGLS